VAKVLRDFNRAAGNVKNHPFRIVSYCERIRVAIAADFRARLEKSKDDGYLIIERMKMLPRGTHKEEGIRVQMW
jgi:hypothetical protein